MSEWMEPDIHEAEDLIDKKPAPAGEYTLTIKSQPRFKKSQKTGTPYLEWFLIHTGDAAKYSPVYERTMLAGRGAFRYFQLLNALGYDTDTIKKSFRYRALAPITQENASEGVPSELQINGEPLNPVGKTLKVTLSVEATESGDRSRIDRYSRP